MEKLFLGIPIKKEQLVENFLSESDIKNLENCECPVCKTLPKNAEERWEYLRHDWVRRTHHNKWVMEEEEKIANGFKMIN